MTGRGLWALTWQELRAAPARASVSVVGIAAGVWVLALVLALGLGARQLILREVVHELPVDMLEVIPKTIDLGLFKIGSGGLFGGEAMGPKLVARLERLPEVAAVYPKLEVKLPLGAQGGASLFGHRLYTDLFMTAIVPELVANEGIAGFVDRPDKVPVLISNGLIELYNASVAPALGTPQIGPQSLVGFQFEIVVGRSLILGDRGAKQQGTEAAQIVGVSPHAMPLGVTVPMATAQRLMERYGAEPFEPVYAALVVRAKHPADISALAEAVEAMGFAIDRTADKTRKLLDAGTYLASSVGVLILLLAALNIAHGFFATLSERRRELGVLRALGAKRGDLLALVLAQAACLGLTGGVAGLILARLCALALDAASHRYLPRFPFKPTSFFVFTPTLGALALSAALVASLLGALWPAWQAARRPIVRSLAD